MAEKDVPAGKRIFGEGSYLRPNFLQFYRCQNVLIEDITLHNSPMWQMHPVLSSNVIVRRVKRRSLGPNNDGCNPESCRDVDVRLIDCTFDNVAKPDVIESVEGLDLASVTVNGRRRGPA